MNKKILMKIRLRADGEWEHVYDDGSVDQEFYELTPQRLAAMYSKKLEVIKNDYIEEAVEMSGYKEANEVIDYIKGLR